MPQSSPSPLYSGPPPQPVKRREEVLDSPLCLLLRDMSLPGAENVAPPYKRLIDRDACLDELGAVGEERRTHWPRQPLVFFATVVDARHQYPRLIVEVKFTQLDRQPLGMTPPNTVMLFPGRNLNGVDPRASTASPSCQRARRGRLNPSPALAHKTAGREPHKK